jgi:hypothetical protein
MKESTLPKSILMDHHEVCALLGVKTDTWRKRVARGLSPLPHSTMGARYYYRRADVRAFIRSGVWPTTAVFRRREAGSRTR